MRRAIGVWVVVFATGSAMASGCGDNGDPDAGRDGGVDGGPADAGPVTSCVGVSDGTPCVGTDGGTNTICLANECDESVCGDEFVDTARDEQCDDGNTTAFDGCETTCEFTCELDSECDDGFVCDGAERCASHACAEGEPAADLTPCTTAEVPAGVCHPLPAPVCLAAECGNGMRDTDEECDDGRNGDATDGCSDDCQLTCTGTTAGCDLVFMPTSHDFGLVDEGAMSIEQTFTIQNIGDAATLGPVNVTIVGADASEFTIVIDCETFLPSFGNCTITVRFHPMGAGPRQAMLVVTAGAGFSGAAELRGFAVGEDGRACMGDAACQSGNCVDGFCCNESADTCNGCRACNVPSSEGTCGNVLSGEDPHDTCDETVACASGACNGSGACGGDQAGTVCQTDSCTGESLTVHLCSNTPGCPATTTNQACSDGYACADASSCHTSCTADSDCGYYFYCDGGTCHPALEAPQACSRNRQCRRGMCREGLCRTCFGGALGCSNIQATSPTICEETANGANVCNRCDGLGRGDASCVDSGMGTRCAEGGCECTAHSECRNAEAPYCLYWNGRNRCSCYTSGGSPYACEPYRSVCVGPSDGTATCKGAPGERCSTGSDCVSSTCNDGVCA